MAETWQRFKTAKEEYDALDQRCEWKKLTLKQSVSDTKDVMGMIGKHMLKIMTIQLSLSNILSPGSLASAKAKCNLKRDAVSFIPKLAHWQRMPVASRFTLPNTRL